MRFMKFLILGAAFFAIAAPANATGLEVPLANAIFAGLYSIGVPGAIANFVANAAFGISAVGGAKVSFR